MNKKIFLWFVLTIVGMTSCTSDLVNIIPLNEASESSIWIDEGLANAAVTDIYNGVARGGLGEKMLASLSDETVFTHSGRGINTSNESRTNSSDIGWENRNDAANHRWDFMYSYIRATNIAITKLAENTLDDTELRERLLGEALFLRAYFYHQLLRFYGGVPLIDVVFVLDSDFNLPRDTFEDCVNFIISDCDRAFQLLNDKEMESGRANAVAALSLKARILTYAASDLHDIPTASSNADVISSYAHVALLGYTTGSQSERWIEAKKASKAVLDYSNYGYKFGLTSPVSLQEGKENYMNVSLGRNGGENDAIWVRQFIEVAGPRVGLYNGPNGYHNWAGNTPLQNLVDAYGMSDGTAFDWQNGTHSNNPYANRDPRFYASILYDGANWKPRPSDVTDRDPVDQIQTGQYEVLNAAGESMTHFGLDTRQGPIEDWNGTRSAYYMQKFIDPDPDVVDQNNIQTIPWPFFRYTEAVLNYVEAIIETGGDENEARSWLNQIRFRAGMPAITAFGTALIQKYRNERQLELVFEEHRYHDARRWMIAKETLGAPAQIIQITGKLKTGANVTTYAYNPTNYEYEYIPSQLPPGHENRLWLDKSYFLPLKNSELNANTSLVQNPGYD